MTSSTRRHRGARQRQRQAPTMCAAAGCEAAADCLYIEATSPSVPCCREHYISLRLAAESAVEDDGEGLLR